MKVSTIILPIFAGLALSKPCSPLVNGAVDTAVSALKAALSLGAPANLNSAIDAGVLAFKSELGCEDTKKENKMKVDNKE